MTVDKIKEEIEKIRSLTVLQKRLCEDAYQGDNSDILKQKIKVTRDELLKSTYNINKIVKDIEERIR